MSVSLSLLVGLGCNFLSCAFIFVCFHLYFIFIYLFKSDFCLFLYIFYVIFLSLVFLPLLVGLGRELFIHEKAMVSHVQLSTNCRIGFFCSKKIHLTAVKLSSPQLVDKYTYGAIVFPCIEFPGLGGNFLLWSISSDFFLRV